MKAQEAETAAKWTERHAYFNTAEGRKEIAANKAAIVEANNTAQAAATNSTRDAALAAKDNAQVSVSQ